MADRYYDHTRRFREHLAAEGHSDLATALADAEVGANTSGELISNVMVILNRLPEDALTPALRDEAASLRTLLQGLWDAANGM